MAKAKYMLNDDWQFYYTTDGQTLQRKWFKDVRSNDFIAYYLINDMPYLELYILGYDTNSDLYVISFDLLTGKIVALDTQSYTRQFDFWKNLQPKYDLRINYT